MDNKFDKIDFSRPVRLTNPQPGEEALVFKIVNYNEVTQRIIIVPLNSDLKIPPQELVSLEDVKN